MPRHAILLYNTECVNSKTANFLHSGLLSDDTFYLQSRKASILRRMSGYEPGIHGLWEMYLRSSGGFSA